MAVATTLGAGVALLAGPAAYAHNVLRSTNPADHSTVDRTPSSIVLTFDQPAIAMGTQVVITGPAGAVQDGPPRLVDTTVTQSIRGGAPAGAYTVLWRVTSIDGHPVNGEFTFTAAAAGVGSSAPVAPTVAAEPGVAPEAGPSGWWALLGLVVAAGLAVTVVAVRRRRIPPSGTGPSGAGP